MPLSYDAMLVAIVTFVLCLWMCLYAFCRMEIYFVMIEFCRHFSSMITWPETRSLALSCLLLSFRKVYTYDSNGSYAISVVFSH
ncbi:hypothetical protein BDN70DRAFT_567707 [Pholiota conissans]|uniref:Uncharacterized protein n=1 Tax=Pholiota conissans TaxID=109636 RepID=A0A9P5YMU0_9AGAR|nr:hypothetical protein BDN70DRAFT_567707 [Pholiota conissans]